MDTEELDQLVRDISTRMDVGIPEVRGPVDGLSHRVYELKYSSGEAWSLRIPKTEVAASISKRGLAVLDHLKKVQPTLWVPRPIYDSETYSLLSFLDGDTLGAWDSFKLTDKRRQQLLNSLATFLLDLWLSPVPQSGWCIWVGFRTAWLGRFLHH
ncbi:hypothetical protein MAC_08993 [Metarhizium acridum CQMa 102]|uniref:Uncharacterized protein n=1 Tax=Metarhizium acridum (strain CQMa 102) TaxID=655827 RepID=E9EGJ5_METAQ|nr:uncharacterized protein MAC_08993 [Metarhizium acridum CQMa 102]EFY84961.1 hypothetical protein MAC_08993 [Metarhizium acridum CQMa 102]